MDKGPFMAGMHYFHKAMADVQWPASLDDVIRTVGKKRVKVDWEEEKSIEELVRGIQIDYFENASQFYCAYFATF